jgi:hypothetical protein
MKDDLTPENLPKMIQAARQAAATRQPEQRPEKRAKTRENRTKAREDRAIANDKPSERLLTDEETQRATEFLRQEQNLFMGTVAGLLTALVGAVAWAGVTVASGSSIGWLAIAIGFATGFAVRTAGKGTDPIFGIVGGVLSLVGCILGNVFTIAWYMSVDAGVPVVDVLSNMDISILVDLMIESFEVPDLLFYALAVYFGYRYSFRELTSEDFDRALGRNFTTG